MGSIGPVDLTRKKKKKKKKAYRYTPDVRGGNGEVNVTDVNSG